MRSHGSTKTTKTKKSFQQFTQREEEEEEEEEEKEKKDLSLVSLSSLSRCFFFHFFFEKTSLSDVGIFFCLSRRVLVRVIFSLFLFSARGKRSSGRAKDARAHAERDTERD